MRICCISDTHTLRENLPTIEADDGYGAYTLGNSIVLNVSSCTRAYKPTKAPMYLDIDEEVVVL